jgi:hypothetical protein
VNDEVLDLPEIAQRLELSLLKTISEPARQAARAKVSAIQMWRVGPVAISCPDSAPNSHSVARTMTQMNTIPVQEKSQSKNGAHTMFRVGPTMLSTQSTAQPTKGDSSASPFVMGKPSVTTSLSSSSTAHQQATNPAAVARVNRNVDKSAVRTWRVGAVLLSTSTKADTSALPAAASAAPRRSDNGHSARTWRVGAALLSTSDSSIRTASSSRQEPVPTPRTIAAQQPTDDKFATRTWRVGPAMVSSREVTSAPTRQAAASSSWSHAAASSPAAGPASPAQQLSGDKFATRTWRMGAVMVSSPEASSAPRPTAAAAVVAAPSSSWAPSSVAAASPASVDVQSRGEEKFTTRTWRMGAVMVSSGEPTTRPRPAAAPAQAAAASVATQEPAGDKLATRTWRVGAAMVSSREAATPSSYVASAASLVAEPLRGDEENFAARTWRVGPALVSTREAIAA